MEHPFHNQHLVDKLTKEQLMELSNIKEMRRSLMAVIYYLEAKEGRIFDEARARQEGEND